MRARFVPLMSVAGFLLADAVVGTDCVGGGGDHCLAASSNETLEGSSLLQAHWPARHTGLRDASAEEAGDDAFHAFLQAALAERGTEVDSLHLPGFHPLLVQEQGAEGGAGLPQADWVNKSFQVCKLWKSQKDCAAECDATAGDFDEGEKPPAWYACQVQCLAETVHGLIRDDLIPDKNGKLAAIFDKNSVEEKVANLTTGSYAIRLAEEVEMFVGCIKDKDMSLMNQAECIHQSIADLLELFDLSKYEGTKFGRLLVKSGQAFEEISTCHECLFDGTRDDDAKAECVKAAVKVFQEVNFTTGGKEEAVVAEEASSDGKASELQVGVVRKFGTEEVMGVEGKSDILALQSDGVATALGLRQKKQQNRRWGDWQNPIQQAVNKVKSGVEQVKNHVNVKEKIQSAVDEMKTKVENLKDIEGGLKQGVSKTLAYAKEHGVEKLAEQVNMLAESGAGGITGFVKTVGAQGLNVIVKLAPNSRFANLVEQLQEAVACWKRHAQLDSPVDQIRCVSKGVKGLIEEGIITKELWVKRANKLRDVLEEVADEHAAKIVPFIETIIFCFGGPTFKCLKNCIEIAFDLLVNIFPNSMVAKIAAAVSDFKVKINTCRAMDDEDKVNRTRCFVNAFTVGVAQLKDTGAIKSEKVLKTVQQFEGSQLVKSLNSFSESEDALLQDDIAGFQSCFFAEGKNFVMKALCVPSFWQSMQGILSLRNPLEDRAAFKFMGSLVQNSGKLEELHTEYKALMRCLKDPDIPIEGYVDEEEDKMGCISRAYGTFQNFAAAQQPIAMEEQGRGRVEEGGELALYRYQA